MRGQETELRRNQESSLVLSGPLVEALKPLETFNLVEIL